MVALSKYWLPSRLLCSSRRALTSVIIFLFFPHSDQVSILSDLDLDLFASRLLDFSLVIGLASFGFFHGFGDSSSSKIVLDGLLHCSWQLVHRYLLTVFILLVACICDGAKCRGSEDGD